MLEIVVGAGIGAAAILAALFIKTARSAVPHLSLENATVPQVDAAAAAQRFAGALTFKTVSHRGGAAEDVQPFLDLHEYLETNFPRTHATLKKDIVAGESLVYEWPGSDNTLKPVLLLGHMDVVPVADTDMASWKHPPFAGVIADGIVWGRGSMDFKIGVLGTLEAVETLIVDGFVPKRTIYLAFGHDEEIGGLNGAAAIAKRFASRDISFDYIFDEGGFIMDNAVPLVDAPIALLGVAEKGYVSVTLEVKGESGHASMPPTATAIGILSRAITRLQESPFPSQLDAVAPLLRYASAGAPLSTRILYSNLWLFGPAIKRRFERNPASNALVRTTTAPTIIGGGIRDNILPTDAHAVVNFRILPGESVASVIERVKKVIGDPRVSLRVKNPPDEPSAMTATESAHFERMRRTIGQIFPDAVTVPYLMPGGTDTKHYAALSENIFRFVPIRIGLGSPEKPHGANECVGVENYGAVVKFYAQLIMNSQ